MVGRFWYKIKRVEFLENNNNESVSFVAGGKSNKVVQRPLGFPASVESRLKCPVKASLRLTP